MDLRNYEDFIEDLVKNYDDFTTSDLEGVIMAKCFKKDRTLMENMEEMDAILDEVYKRVNKGV